MTEAKIIDTTKPAKHSKLRTSFACLITNPAPKSWYVILLVAQVIVAGGMVFALRVIETKDEPQTHPTQQPRNNSEDMNLLEYVLEVDTDPDPPKTRSSKPRGQKVTRVPGLAKINRPLELNIPSGTLMEAHLVRAEENGDVIATLVSAASGTGRHLVPDGLTLKGKASTSERRLYLSFDSASSRDGGTTPVSAIGVDPHDRKPGLEFESLLNTVSRELATAGGTFLSGYGKGLQQEKSYGPFSATKPNPKSAVLQGLGNTVSSHTDELVPKKSEVDLTGSKFLVKFL